jgi:isocitrate/isopropylmalate dehydrogenase
MDAAAERHPDVRYQPQLIDATFALLIGASGDPLVIPALNRDGDTLSDFVLQMFGSIAGAESVIIGFNDAHDPKVVLAEAPHGTAPKLFGKNVANPMAMILACAAVGSYLPHPAAPNLSRAIYEATFEAVQGGVRTLDLGGDATTTEFTDEVIRRMRLKLDVWRSLGRG